MAASLRSYLPRLSQILGLTPIALYERQRELVRAGLLASEGAPKRGPGAGVRLTPDSVTVMVIAVLAGDSLSDVAAQTRAFLNATCRDRELGAHWRTFKEAIVEILSDSELAKKVIEVSVSRSQRRCEIILPKQVYYDGEVLDDYHDVVFACGLSIASDFPFSRVSVKASIEDLHLIADDLRVAEETGEAPQPQDENEEGWEHVSPKT